MAKSVSRRRRRAGAAHPCASRPRAVVPPPPARLVSAGISARCRGAGRRDPYAILVSELMLQQTQVARVMGHWPRFLRRYPTVEDLAEATVDAVRERWEGLGYYARARNLHAAARHVVATTTGSSRPIPATLRSLPGIGRYTAGAVASIAFGADEAAVDTNVARVLRRVFRVPGARDRARTRSESGSWPSASCRRVAPATGTRR